MPIEKKFSFAHLIFLNLLAIGLLLLAVACTAAGPGSLAATATPTAPEVPAGDTVTDLAALEQTEWWLADIGGEAVDATAVEPPVSLRLFPGGDTRERPEFSASSFCNSLGGTVQLEANRVFAVEGQTDFACGEALKTRDAAVISAIEQAAALQVSEGHLVLLDDNGQALLRYRPKPAAILDPALSGSEWTLATLRGEAPLDGTRITLEFSGPSAGGNAGCNSYGAEIRTVAEGTFNLASTAMTQMACEQPEGIMAQESAYLDAFTSAASYQVEGDKLTLIDEAGQPLLTYTRQLEEAVDPAILVGSGWRLMTYNGGPVDARRPVTLIFGEGRYWGQSECRSYVGTYEATGDDIFFPSTSMLGESCPDEQLLLPENGDYQFVDGRLTLMGARGDSYAYDPLTSDTRLPLAGPTWQLLAFVGPDDTPAAVQEPLPDTGITATFAAEGSVNGSIGCNAYFGSYEVTGTDLAIGTLGATEAFCDEPEGIMEQEGRYAMWLQEATAYQSHGGLLWLDVAGDRALLFTAVGE